MRVLALLVAALATVGSIRVEHETSSPAVSVVPVEVPFGRLAPGSGVGLNATNATASVAGGLLSLRTTDLLYLNNTNATGAYHVRIALADATGLAGLSTLEIGVANGTSTVAQVVVSAGTLTQGTGAYVRLEPGSANRVYASTLVGAAFLGATASVDVLVADHPDERAYYVMRGALRVT